jgi:hypothetical protein
MTDILDIGSAVRDPNTNEIKVQAKSAPIGNDADDAPGFDGIPLVCALGVSAMPWPQTAEGNAQCVVDPSLPGTNGWATCARDQRKAAAGVVEELGPGETALHSTGEGFDARVFCKNQLIALMVGDDTAIVIDRQEEQITISIAGMHIEASKKNGAVLTSGNATVQVKDSVATITAPQIVLGGRTPIGNVLYSTPAAPGFPVPAPGVFIGA